MRGAASGEARERFLNPSWRNMPGPDELPGVSAAAARIFSALDSGLEIVVFGDYDTDGVCAAAIFARSFRAISPGAKIHCVLPNRFSEGYGLTQAAADRIVAECPAVKLVVTVDNGISSAAEIARLKERGIDVIVTDHHLPGDELPAAPIVNPHLSSCPGCENLCGSGVAYYIAWALFNAAARRGIYVPRGLSGELLVLAGLATVADIVPLTGANRDIVSESLRLFPRCAPAGLRELYRQAARRAGELTARDYSHLLSPRLNAAGRMKTADIAYRLLMCSDPDQGREIASCIEACNAERRQCEYAIASEAETYIRSNPGRAAYHVCGDGWHRGVLGIVAGRLSDRYGVPVAVSDGEIGSIRSPDGINVREVLDDCRDLLVRYGGHASACGFQLKPGVAERFSDTFADACARRSILAGAASSAARQRAADVEISPGDVTAALWRDLQVLQPFGEGNPEPVFAINGVAIKGASPMGDEKRHLSAVLDTDPVLRGVWWAHGDAAHELAHSTERLRNVSFTISLNRYGEAELTFRNIENG